MGGTSRRSFRINGLNPRLNNPEFATTVEKLNGGIHKRYLRCLPRTSLTFHDNKKCCTVSCRSKTHKHLLMFAARGCPDLMEDTTFPPQCEDSFRGLTIIHSPVNPDLSPMNADIDVCFVHGMNGHAMDTFERATLDPAPPVSLQHKQTIKDWKDRRNNTPQRNLGENQSGIRKQRRINEDPEELPHWMWPRDFLPHEDSFSNARIMTFDYESHLRKTGNRTGLQHWSKSLLKDINGARKDASDRPIIFVGYSMGGIVTRQAAVDLWDARGTRKYPNVNLRQCGFMFLGTPHDGSPYASIGRPGKFFLKTLGYRTEMLDILRYFSPQIHNHREKWRAMSKNEEVGHRPMICFAESDPSAVLGGLYKCMIVTETTASWMLADAIPIDGTDHHNICAYFNFNDSAYKQIVDGLEFIKKELKAQRIFDEDRPRPMPNKSLQSPVTNAVSASSSQSEGGADMPPIVPMDSPQNTKTEKTQSQWRNVDIPEPGRPRTAKKAADSGSHSLKKAFGVPSETTFSPEKLHHNIVVDHTAVHVGMAYGAPIASVTFTATFQPSRRGSDGPQDSPMGSSFGRSETPSNMKDNVKEFPLPRPIRDSVLSHTKVPEKQPEYVGRLTNHDASTRDDISRSWKRNSVLSLDGGGVRGYTTLLLLGKLMDAIDKIERSESSSSEDPDLPWMNRPLDKLSLSRSSSYSSISPVHMIRRLSGFQTQGNPAAIRITQQQAHKRKHRYLPCHYFDYVFGSGTGGVIAIMLGRLRMSIPECIGRYKALDKQLFQIPQQPLVRSPLVRRNRRGREAEASLQELVEYHTRYPEGSTNLKTDEDLCKTATTAFKINGPSVLKMFRSYDNVPAIDEPEIEHVTDNVLWNTSAAKTRSVPNSEITLAGDHPRLKTRVLSPGAADTCQIWQAGRVTSAAPSSFNPVIIDNTAYLDGGIALNNPSRESINEVLSLHEQRADSVKCLVSIGCGRPRRSVGSVGSYHGGLKTLSAKSSLKAIALDSFLAHEGTEDVTAALKIPYFRFDAQGEIWELPHSVHGSRSEELYARLERDVEKYFSDEKAIKQLTACATMLFEQRKERTQDADRWRRFAYATFFLCPHCTHDEERFALRRDLEAHLNEKHSGWAEDLKSEAMRHEFLKKYEKHPSIGGGPL